MMETELFSETMISLNDLMQLSAWKDSWLSLNWLWNLNTSWKCVLENMSWKKAVCSNVLAYHNSAFGLLM